MLDSLYPMEGQDTIRRRGRSIPETGAGGATWPVRLCVAGRPFLGGEDACSNYFRWS